MDYKTVLKELTEKMSLEFSVANLRDSEIYLLAKQKDFKSICLALHKLLNAPVASFFALDAREEKGSFEIYCSFMSAKYKKCFFVVTEIAQDNPRFDSLAREIYSASLFEREIREMFGIEPCGNPDLRPLRLHNEIWPKGVYPLRKDFKMSAAGSSAENYSYFPFK